MPKPTTEFDRALTRATQAYNNRQSLWDLHRDGITFSMLNRFLSCRERFRLYAVEGLRGLDDFNYKMQYGNAWHICEESLAAEVPWNPPLVAYCQQLSRDYPAHSYEIDKLYECCKAQFPVYVDYWQHNDDVKGRTPIYQEKVFDVRYPILYGLEGVGKSIRLRGKWDANDGVKRPKQKQALFVQENKSKSIIDDQMLKRQLPYDLQSLIYLSAMILHKQQPDCHPLFKALPIGGVRYNVVLRPLSGGKHSISQHKEKIKKGKPERIHKGTKKLIPAIPDKITPGETKEAYYKRLQGLIRTNPKHFFSRICMDISPEEIKHSQATILTPILLQVYHWWESIKADPFDPWSSPLHWISPYGTYSTVTEGRVGEYDHFLSTGSMSGLRHTEALFSELQEA